MEAVKNRRGPKPRPPGICKKCGRVSTLCRGYCQSCYTVALRQGVIARTPIIEMPTQFTPFQEEVFVGHMLGDGCLYRDKPTHTPYLSLSRTRGDRVYLEWTAGIFQNFAQHAIIDDGSLDERTGKAYLRSKFSTRRAPVFNPQYERWYPGDVKIVPEDIVLTPLILAIWFLDDGSIETHRYPWTLKIKLATHGFSHSGVLRLSQMLQERYSQSFPVIFDGGYPVIRAGDASARAFISEIDEVLPPGMDRKAYWRESCAQRPDTHPARPPRKWSSP